MKESYEQQPSSIEPMGMDHSPPAIPPTVSTTGTVLQTLGLTPAVAVSTIVVDLMLSAMDWMTLGLFIFFGFVAAASLGYFTYHMQRQSGDPEGVARAKGLLIAALTCLPIALTPLIAVPAGVAGFISKVREK